MTFQNIINAKESVMNKMSKKVLKNRIQPFMYISQPHLIHPNPSFIGLFPERASEELKKKSTYALNICQAQKK